MDAADAYWTFDMPNTPHHHARPTPPVRLFADRSKQLGDTVAVYQGTENIKVGRVETITRDCKNLWVECVGAFWRELHSRDEGVTITPVQQ